MTLKQLIIVLAIVGALGAVDFVMHQKQKSDIPASVEPRRGEKVFKDLALDDISKITISEKVSKMEEDPNSESGEKIEVQTINTLHVTKSAKGWVVEEQGSYPAFFPDIRGIVKGIADLEITASENVESDFLKMFELEDPTAEGSKASDSAVRVDLSGADGKIMATLFVGKVVRDEEVPTRGSGTYMKSVYVRNGTEPSIFLINRTEAAPPPNPMGFPMSPLGEWLSFSAGASDWIDKSFFNVSRHAKIEVKHPNPEDSWTVVMTPPKEEGGEDQWNFIDPQPGKLLDINSKASGIRGLLINPSFREVVNPEIAKGLDWSKDASTATITTSEGFTYVLTTMKKDPESETSDYYLKVQTTAEIPDQRPAEKGELDSLKVRKDADYAANLPRLKEKLAKEQAYNDWVYEVSEYNVSTLLKTREEITIDEPKEEPEEPTDPALPTDPPAPTDPTDSNVPEEPADPTDPPAPVDPTTPADPAPPAPTPSDPTTPPETPAPTDSTPSEPEATPADPEP